MTASSEHAEDTCLSRQQWINLDQWKPTCRAHLQADYLAALIDSLMCTTPTDRPHPDRQPLFKLRILLYLYISTNQSETYLNFIKTSKSWLIKFKLKLYVIVTNTFCNRHIWYISIWANIQPEVVQHLESSFYYRDKWRMSIYQGQFPPRPQTQTLIYCTRTLVEASYHVFHTLPFLTPCSTLLLIS